MWKKIVFGALVVLAFSPVLLSGVAFADVLDSQSMVTESTTSTLNVKEGETVTLQEIIDSLNLSPQQKEYIISETLKMANDNQATDGSRSARMSTVIKRLSPAQVKRAANSNDWVGYLSGLVPTVGIPLGAIYMLNGQTLRTAADHGWGLEVVFTANPNNPTSTGMSFSWRYVK